MVSVTPFRISVPEHDLVDLRERLRRSRLLPDSPGRPASGMTADYLAELVESWADFDWRAREEWLNAHPQVLVDVEGATLHAVHLRAPDPEAPALLVMHGWPHTFALQLDFAERLQSRMHVVVVSLPGFGFSTPYREGPMTDERLVRSVHELMTEHLGYETYVTYGEDVSASINDLLAVRYPNQVTGIIATHPHFAGPSDATLSAVPEVQAFRAHLERERASGGAYSHAQATRPDTLAVGLNDSPAALLAWIVEKFVEWADVDTDDPRSLETRISRERILTEVTLYWVTQTVATSFRPYFDHHSADAEPTATTTVPAAVFIQRHEADYPEVMARAFYRDLRVFERLSEGGHFTAAEVPEALAQRVGDFVESLTG